MAGSLTITSSLFSGSKFSASLANAGLSLTEHGDGSQIHGGQALAVLEGVVADLPDGGSQDDLLQVGQAVEGHLADSLDALLDDDLDDLVSIVGPGQGQDAVDLVVVGHVDHALVGLAGGVHGQNAVRGQIPQGAAGPAGGDDHGTGSSGADHILAVTDTDARCRTVEGVVVGGKARNGDLAAHSQVSHVVRGGKQIERYMEKILSTYIICNIRGQ